MNKMNLSEVKWGEIYLCNLGISQGSVQSGVRPVLVIQNNIGNEHSPSGWNAISNPSSDATIIDVKSEEVQYAKNNAKYKTTVTFSDGFYFVTHETNRENSFFSYKITVDKFLMSRIIDNAKRAHEKAVIKATKKK